MSKIGDGAGGKVVQGMYYYNALENFVVQQTGLSFSPFKPYGYARPRGRNKQRENGWGGRTYLNNGYNTGNPLSPDTYERQDISRNIFGRDYYINIQNSSINSTQIYNYDNIYSYIYGTAPGDATTVYSPGTLGAAEVVRHIRVSGCTDNNINGIYKENTPGVYSKSGFLSTIELIGGYWTLISNSIVQYTADDVYTNPWDVSFWDPDAASGTLLVEDDIREFTWQPLVDFVSSITGVNLVTCNIFANLAFDQYAIFGTRWPAFSTDNRPIMQRVPFANLAWPSAFRLYYLYTLPLRT